MAQPNPWMRFSAMGFQMAATIVLCTWLGSLLDDPQAETAWGTGGGALLGAILAIYIMIKEVTNVAP